MVPVELIAHRGFPRRFPENSLIGFEKAIGCGATALEADVQLSADGVAVLAHDRTLSRVCGLPFAVHELSTRRLKRLSAFEPHRFGNQFRGYRLALLSELVAMLSAFPGVTAYIEIKPCALKVFGAEPVVDVVLDTLAPIAPRCVLLSQDLGCLEYARASGWQRLAVVLRSWASQREPRLIALRPETLFCNLYKVPLGAAYNRDDMRLAVYDLMDPRGIVRWSNRGATLIETFDIQRLREALTGVQK